MYRHHNYSVMMQQIILGLSNTEDALWYKLSPTDDTLRALDDIFGLHNHLCEYEVEGIVTYESFVADQEINFHCEEGHIAHFIFTKQKAQVILRKTLGWQALHAQMLERFAFKG
jgi:hypothetical protein